MYQSNLVSIVVFRILDLKLPILYGRTLNPKNLNLRKEENLTLTLRFDEFFLQFSWHNSTAKENT